MSENQCIVAVLKREREKRGLDPAELATSLRLHPHVIKDWEDGKRHPRFKTAVRWADALGYDIQIARRP